MATPKEKRGCSCSDEAREAAWKWSDCQKEGHEEGCYVVHCSGCDYYSADCQDELAVSCDGCEATLVDPEEIVVGYWDGDCFIAEGNNRESATYCLSCAPCECDDHEKFAPHTAENIEKKGVLV